MTILMLATFNMGCSSDDSTAPIIEPPTTIDFKKAILKTWQFDKVQFLDKDKKVIEELPAIRFGGGCEGYWKVWDFTTEYLKTFQNELDMDGDCSKIDYQMGYEIQDKKLSVSQMHSGDVMQYETYDIVKLDDKDFIIADFSVEFDDEDVEYYNLPKSTKFLQYTLTLKK